VANYVFVYKGGGMAATEAEQKAAMAAWGQWFGGLGGAVVDPEMVVLDKARAALGMSYFMTDKFAKTVEAAETRE